MPALRAPLLTALLLLGCRTPGAAVSLDSLRTPVSPHPAYAPPPPAMNSAPVWAPEPPAITAALQLRAEQPEKALAALRAAAVEAKAAGERRTEAIALHRAGDVTLDLGDCEAAEGLYLEALQLHRAGGDLPLVATAATDLGLMCGACRRNPLRWFELALQLREKLGDATATRKAVHNLGGAMMLWGHPKEARPLIERGLAMAEAQRDRDAQRKSQINLASCLELEGGAAQHAAALGHLAAAIALARQMGLGPNKGACRGLVRETQSLCDELYGGQPPPPDPPDSSARDP